MHRSEFVHNIVDKLLSVQGMQAIVLGGSWASGTQRPDSDIDLGLYYGADLLLDIHQVRNIAIDVYFIAGCLTRTVSCLVQVLYALNETYFISDKRIYKDVEKFNMKPEDFSARVDRILGAIGSNREELSESLQAAGALVGEMIALCGNQYRARY